MTREQQWLVVAAHRAPTPARPTRRVQRDAARLLATQSARGNRDADVVTAALHRAGWDMRPPEPRGWTIVWGLLAVTFAAMLVVFAIWAVT